MLKQSHFVKPKGMKMYTPSHICRLGLCRKKPFMLITAVVLFMYLLTQTEKSYPSSSKQKKKQIVPGTTEIHPLQNTSSTDSLISHFRFVLNLLARLPKHAIKEPLDRRLFLRGDEFHGGSTKMETQRVWIDPILNHPALYTQEELHKFRDIVAGYEKRLADVIIIGCKKCGTTLLKKYLTLHSHLAVAHTEPHFFDTNDRYTKGLEFYMQLMPTAFSDQLVVEKTPKYWVVEAAPERLFHTLTRTKLLLIVRDPVERAISDFHHEQMYSKKYTRNMTFEEYITFSNGSLKLDSDTLLPSYYDLHMNRWLNYYDLSQIHIIKTDHLTEDVVGALSDVEEFLGIPEEFAANIRITPEGVCMDTHSVLGGSTCIKRFNHDFTPVSKHVTGALRAAFKPHMQEFYKIIGRQLEW